MSSSAVSSPSMNESTVSPLLWGTATSSSPADNNNNNAISRSSTRSTPIAIVRNSEENDDDSSDDGGDVVQSFQQLILQESQQQDEFCVGSLPTRRRTRRTNKHAQLGTSLPAAPLLRSKMRNLDNEAERYAAIHDMMKQSCTVVFSFSRLSPQYSIPPISLSEREETVASPSYGSLRESQLAGRFLDGPSSYRDKTSGQIKQWAQEHRVRFQQNSIMSKSPSERMRQQQDATETTTTHQSSLSELMSASSAPQSSFVDHDYSLLQDENVLSTSLTGLELLQRNLSISAAAGGDDAVPPDASHLSSWSSSGANTYTGATNDQHQQDHTTTSSLLVEEGDDEREQDDTDDDSPVFDLDME